MIKNLTKNYELAEGSGISIAILYAYIYLEKLKYNFDKENWLLLFIITLGIIGIAIGTKYVSHFIVKEKRYTVYFSVFVSLLWLCVWRGRFMG